MEDEKAFGWWEALFIDIYPDNQLLPSETDSCFVCKSFNLSYFLTNRTWDE
jgi:hypothetical protein